MGAEDWIGGSWENSQGTLDESTAVSSQDNDGWNVVVRSRKSLNKVTKQLAREENQGGEETSKRKKKKLSIHERNLLKLEQEHKFEEEYTLQEKAAQQAKSAKRKAQKTKRKQKDPNSTSPEDNKPFFDKDFDSAKAQRAFEAKKREIDTNHRSTQDTKNEQKRETDSKSAKDPTQAVTKGFLPRAFYWLGKGAVSLVTFVVQVMLFGTALGVLYLIVTDPPK